MDFGAALIRTVLTPGRMSAIVWVAVGVGVYKLLDDAAAHWARDH